MTPEDDSRDYTERYETIYRGLPPLDSPEYLHLLKDAKPEELPAEVLVRVYRQLRHGEAAGATVEMLLVRHQAFYFQRVRNQARSDVSRRKDWVEVEDMVQDVMAKVCEALHGKRGRHAEANWVMFTLNLYRDVRRTYFGRNGARGSAERSDYDEEGLSLRADIEVLKRYAAGAGPRHSGFDQTALIEAAVAEAVKKIGDPFLRRVAEDQFGRDPTPISGRGERDGSGTLSAELSVSRHVVERALKKARKIVGAALLADRTLDLKEEWIRRFISPDGRRSSARASRPR